MFLKEFSVEKKRIILDLGIYAAKSDDVMTDEEKAVIDRLVLEMDLSKGYEPVNSLESTLFSVERFFTEEDKKKIFVELVAVVSSDHITQREEEFLHAMQKHLHITDEKYDLAVSVAKDFLRVVSILDKYFAD